VEQGHRRVPPKLIALSELLEEHGEEIEYDLQHHHRVELTGLWTGDLSWRRLGVLVRNLPPESATKTALRNATPVEDLQDVVEDADREYGSWSQTDMLLAELIDVARWLQWSKTKAAEDRPNESPKPYPRPGVDRTPSQRKVTAKVIDLLEYMRSHNGAAPEGYVEQ
jgi:hypothetical protein